MSSDDIDMEAEVYLGRDVPPDTTMEVEVLRTEVSELVEA